MKTIITDWVAKHWLNTPEAIATIDLPSGRQFTYAQLSARVARLAGFLRGMGIAAGDRVAALGPTGSDIAEIQYAAWRVGAAFVPLNNRLAIPELAFAIGDSTPGVVFYHPHFEALREMASPDYPELVWVACAGDGSASDYERAIAGPQQSVSDTEFLPESIAQIIYSSGTTGRPKGVVLTHQNILFGMLNSLIGRAFKPKIVVPCYMPLFHIAGLNGCLNLSHLTGGTALMMEQFDPTRVLELVDDELVGINYLFGVPTILEILRRHPLSEEVDFSRISTFLVGGAAVPPELVSWWSDHGVPVSQVFGLTETAMATSIALPHESQARPATVGKPGLFAEYRVVTADGEDVSEEASNYQDDGTLPDVFENHIAGADDVSDRLRREADRVHALANLQAKQNGAQKEADRTAKQIEAISTEKDQLGADWQELWTPSRIVPRTPREMRVWLDEFAKLRDQVEQLNLLRQRMSELEQNRTRHIELLNQQLKDMGRAESSTAELENVLLECEAVVKDIDESKRKHDALSKEVKDREDDVESLSDEHRMANEALESWQTQWGELMRSFGLRIETSPSEADDLVESVRTLFAKQNETEKLQIRINAIDEDAEAFCSELEDVVTTIAPELDSLPPGDAVARLNALLSENRSKRTKRQQIEEQIDLVKEEIRDSKTSIKTMTEFLEVLCIESKCEDHDHLEEVERRSTDFLRIRSAIDSVEQEILEMGEGADLAALEAEAEGIDPDSLPGRIKELDNKINDELEPRRTELAEAKGREEKELELMDGSDHAAVLADQAQATLASIRSDAERYIHVKLAGKILRDQIEHYRQENQGPLVKRASEHFSALTLGSFEGLMTDFNEKDEPVLAGIRPGGERVYVEGMSSGTRDQLYLALRLASLEKYMESSESMPFMVDDILVDFDDDRSQAALSALAELAEKTQVILFTHHSQVVEQSKQLKGPVRVHEL